MANRNDTIKAKRFNEDKIDLSLLPVTACEEEAKVWMFGAAKYGGANWKKLWGGDTINVAIASLLRHAFAIIDGEVNDKESGLDHAAHIRCNAAMILEYRKKQKQIEVFKVAKTTDDYLEEETEWVEVEFTNYRPFYGGSSIGFQERKVIPRKDLELFLQRNKDARLVRSLG